MSLRLNDLEELLASLNVYERQEFKERLRRAKALDSPFDMGEYTWGQRWIKEPFMRYISDQIVDTVQTGGQLILCAPVRHGKSIQCSLMLPLWFLANNPEKNVMFASYNGGFAQSWGMKVRDLVESYGSEFGLSLRRDARAAYKWQLQSGGSMITGGCGGSGSQFTGRGGDILIVDDPFASAMDASSQKRRDRVWEWWQGTWITRREESTKAAVIVLSARWHEDDLVGRLKNYDTDSDWKIIDIPALAMGNDLLGRKPGEALWPSRWSADRLNEIRKKGVGEYYFAALYQQRPAPSDGLLFKRDAANEYELMSDGYHYSIEGREIITPRERLHVFITVDLAVSAKETADYTAIACWGMDGEGTLLLLDMDRRHLEGPDQLPAITLMKDHWNAKAVYIEAVQHQLAVVQSAKRQGLPAKEIRPKGDKVARAQVAAMPWDNGKILIPKKNEKWKEIYLEEMIVFNNGTHDDQVDCTSYAAEIATKLPRMREAKLGAILCECGARVFMRSETQQCHKCHRTLTKPKPIEENITS